MGFVRRSLWLGAAGFAAGIAATPSRPRGEPTAPGASSSSVVAIAKAAAASAVEDRILSVAAAVAFYALLALVPALSVLVSIYGLFTPPGEIPAQLDAIGWLLPSDVRRLVGEQAVRLAATSNGTLSLTLFVSLAFAGWSANAAVKGAFEALDVMYGVRETRSFVRLNLVSLGFTFAAVAMTIVTLVALAVVPGLLALLPVSAATGTTLSVVRWPILLVTAFLAVAMLYRNGPNRPAPPFRRLVPGAATATLLWAAASGLFSWYAASLGSYPATYGSLAGIVVVLTWLWISAVIVLAGAELTAEVEARAVSTTRS